MIIKTLEVRNFRNHEHTRIELSPGINFFVGENAQGKTNLLEAIYLTCVGRGWRTNKDRDMILFNKDTASVKTLVNKSYGNITIEIGLSNTAKKSIKINDIPVGKMGELMGQINCVFFSPDELRLIKDAPADRRRFLDIDISQIDKTYFYALMRYGKTLAQRNAYLKDTSQHKNPDFERGLDIWDAQLARVGAILVSKRLLYIERLKPHVDKVHNHLTRNKEQITISYINTTTIDSAATESVDTPTHELIETVILKQLYKSREKDLRLRTTTVGPHRDDLLIQINDKDVRHFASQGQQRTAALSLKLAELEVFEQLTSERPILLLDDVFSELDTDRQDRLIKLLSKCQSIITSTQAPINCDTCHKVYRFVNGKIKDL